MNGNGGSPPRKLEIGVKKNPEGIEHIVRESCFPIYVAVSRYGVSSSQTISVRRVDVATLENTVCSDNGVRVAEPVSLSALM